MDDKDNYTELGEQKEKKIRMLTRTSMLVMLDDTNISHTRDLMCQRYCTICMEAVCVLARVLPTK